jgi:hypothetical protein
LVAELKDPGPAEVKLVQAAILRRRLAYFATLIPVLCLLAYPVIGRILPGPEWDNNEYVAAPLGEVGDFIASITPKYLSPWLNAFTQNPVVAGVLALAALFFAWRGKILRTLIGDRAREAWGMGRNVPTTAPGGSRLDRMVLRLNDSPQVNAAWNLVTWKVFPTFALGLTVILLLAFLDRSAFWLRSSTGNICVSETANEKLQLIDAQWRDITFRADDPCMATGYRLSRDRKYEIVINLLDDANWTDAGNAAYLPGLDFTKLSWRDAVAMNVGSLIRRHMWEPWFVPVARIGKYGSDEHVLVPVDVDGRKKPLRTMTTVLSPRSNGELFLFVNDAYSGLFPLAWIEPNARKATGLWAPHLYGNNEGTAQVRIRREGGRSD